MKFHTSSALFFAASIALAVAVPARTYYRPASSYEDDEQGMVAMRQPYTLSSAPFFYQPRTLELDAISNTGRKYKVVKRKKHGNRPVFPQSDEEDDDEPQDEESGESSEEEADEEGGGGGDREEEAFDTPGWDKLFPEDDKNTGNFDDQGGQGGQSGGYGGQGGQGGYGGQGGGYGGEDGGYGPQGAYGTGSLANLPTGGPAPESSGSIMNLFGMGGGSGSDESGSDGPQSLFGGGGGGGGGAPGQYRQGPPPRSSRPPYQAVRSRSSLPVEEPRSGGAVLYDGYRYIPVKPVHVRIPQRQSKKVNKQNAQARTLKTTPTTSTRPRQNKKLPSKKQRPQPQYVLVPMDRDSREIRFSRDQHGFSMEHAPVYSSPTEIWRWEGPGGRPLRRRDNRPAYYSSRPHNRRTTVRFAEENDY